MVFRFSNNFHYLKRKFQICHSRFTSVCECVYVRVCVYMPHTHIHIYLVRGVLHFSPSQCGTHQAPYALYFGGHGSWCCYLAYG